MRPSIKPSNAAIGKVRRLRLSSKFRVCVAVSSDRVGRSGVLVIAAISDSVAETRVV